MSQTYRVGIIGCGGMSRIHANAYTENPRTTLVAAMDIDKDSAAKLSQEYSIPAVYTDYNKLLETEDLDIVSIVTWQGVRAEITIAAAEAGVKGILGEKPMASCLGEADDMIETCEKHGAKLVIGHQGRFSPMSVEIRRLIRDGAIGQPTLLHGRSKPNAGLLNIGTHVIDGWRYQLSDPETLWVIGQISRTTDKWERRTLCEDLCMGLICFEGGARGIYESDLPEPAISGTAIHGTAGQIRNDADGKLVIQTDESKGWTEIQAAPEESNQFQELIDWMEGKIGDHRSSGRQARYTMEIMMAIYESLRIKNVVNMPLETKESPLELMVQDGTLPVLKEGRYDIRRAFPEQ
ncbi:MAG: Gfo/Idh/MocA family oxidoreductase [Candidatus Poribacteria bacterium]|nr:Gfo/Idh/MocA family oxidoreductase [Candidatus Poribacteria bacterium]